MSDHTEHANGTTGDEAQLALTPRDVCASPRQRRAYPWQRAYGSACEAWGPLVRAVAQELAEGDEEHAADLVQEAYVRLWELDTSRLDARDHAWVQRQLMVRMRRVARREERHAGPVRRVEMEQAAEEKPLLGLLEQEGDLWTDE